MTELYPNNFKLKNGSAIIIDGKDVDRIKILNNTVWEKAKSTTLTLNITPNTPVAKQNFTLQVMLTDSDNKVVNGEVYIAGEGANKTIKTTNGVGELVIKAKDFDFTNKTFNSEHNGYLHTYTATFNQSGRYLESTTTKNIYIKKDTPKIEIVGLENNKNNLYYTWNIGCKLTDINSALIKNYPVCITINGRKYPRLTNNNGIAVCNITLGEKGQYEATFISHGNAIYNNNEKKYTYNYLKYNDVKLPYLSCNLGEVGAYKDWIQIDTNKYQCGTIGPPCNSSNGIPKNSKPDLLKITFNKNNISSNIYKVKLTFNSYSLSNNCYTPAMGGLFKSTPQIQLSRNGSTFESGNNILPFPSQYAGSEYSSNNLLSQSITWGNISSSNYDNAFPITTNPIISFQYPLNEGVQEGAIQISDILLTVSEVPTQTFNFGEIKINENDNSCINDLTIRKGITNVEFNNDGNLVVTTIENTTIHNETITLIKDIFLIDGNMSIETVTISKNDNADDIVTDIEIKNQRIIVYK